MKLGVLGALGVLLFCVGGSPAAVPAAVSSAHVIFTSDRDGDVDVYGASADGRRIAALTRNRSTENDVLISPTGAWLALTRDFKRGILVAANGRRERRLPGMPTAFSGDGQLVATTTEDADEHVTVGVVGVNGRGARRFGAGFSERFSPDGSLLMFWTRTGALGVIDLAGGRRTIVLSPDEYDDAFDPVWSPAWKNLAYLRSAEMPSGLFDDELVVRSRTDRQAQPVVLLRGADAHTPIFWIDDERLALATGGPIRIVRVDGTTERSIGNDVDEAAFSPTGGMFAFTESLEGGNGTASKLHFADVDGAQARSVELPGRPYGVSWSPSGRLVAVISGVGSKSIVAIVDAVANNLVQTFEMRRASVSADALWSPDERHVLLESNRNLLIVPVSGGRRTQIPTPGNSAVVGWMRGALPRSAPKAPPPPAVEVATATGLSSRGKIVEIASDSTWAAAIVDWSPLDCNHVIAWNTTRRSIVRFERVAACDRPPGLGSLAMKGHVVTWTSTDCGTECETLRHAADVRRPRTDVDLHGRIPRPAPLRETRGGVTCTFAHGTITLRSKRSGAVRRIRPPGGAVDAELETSGLFYAYNVRARFPGRLVFVPFSRLFG